MSRKDFQAFADSIRRIDNAEERERAAKLVADVCAGCNGRFDRGRFYRACGIKSN